MQADVFLEEAVVEPAVLGFVAKSIVYVIGSHMVTMDLSTEKCMDILYSMKITHFVKIESSEQEKGLHLLT